jgi:hypothetical protein
MVKGLNVKCVKLELLSKFSLKLMVRWVMLGLNILGGNKRLYYHQQSLGYVNSKLGNYSILSMVKF